MTIVRKNSILLILVGLLPILASVVIHHSTIEQSAEQSVSESVTQVSSQLALMTAQHLHDGTSFLRVLSHNPVIQQPDSSIADVQSEIQKVFHLQNVFDNVGYFDSDQTHTAMVNNLAPENWAYSEWYLAAIKNEPNWSQVSTSGSADETVIIYAYPVQDDNGNTRGVLAGRVLLDHMWSGLQASVKSSSEIYLLNQKGFILDDSHTIAIEETYPAHLLTQSVISRKTGILDSAEHGNDIVASVAPLPRNTFFSNLPRWSVLVAQSTDEAYFRAGLQKQILYVASAVFLTFTILASIYAGRWFHRRIGTLIEATRMLGSGDLNVRIPDEHLDELGTLGRQFNAMADQIQELYDSFSQQVLHIRQLIDSSINPIILLSNDNRIQMVNAAFLQMLGIDSNVLGWPIDSFIPTDSGVYDSTTGERIVLNKEYFEEYEQKVEELSQTDKLSHWEAWYLDSKGRLVPVIQNVVQVHDANGEPHGQFAMIRDVTLERRHESEIIEYRDHLEQQVESRTQALEEANRELMDRFEELNRTQEQLKRATKDAESANAAKSAFLATMSHEIRTPLNGIIGMTELAFDSELSYEQRSIFETIRVESNALLTIVSDILDFSKIEAGKIDMESIPFDVGILLDEVVAEFSHRAEEKHLELFEFIPPEIQTGAVGDPNRLKQVLRNLIGNAVKFTNEGFVSVCARQLKSDDPSRLHIGFEIKDTGVGIPPDKLSSIFDRFTQADGSTTRQFGGTGLGTSIARQLVELMGGKIQVESTVGEGSIFSFHVDLEACEALTMTQPSLSDSYRVLAIEDNEIGRAILDSYLQSWGCETTLVPSGGQGLASFRNAIDQQKPYDLVLCDDHLPDMEGVDLISRMRQMNSDSDVPVLLMSGSTRMLDESDRRRLGIRFALHKPIKQNELFTSVNASLNQPKNVEEPILPVVNTSNVPQIGEGRRVLLVEDYPTNQKVGKQYLDKVGFEIDIAMDGRQAVQAFQDRQYDLILMDIQMPVMDGYEATRMIRALEKDSSDSNEPTPRIPIIAMTAHATQEYLEQCIHAGMDDYLTKPLKRETLISTLENWISGQAVSRQPVEKKQVEPNLSTVLEKDAPIDLNEALNEFLGDRDLLSEVIDEFLKTVDGQVKTLSDAIGTGDSDTVAKEAHAIKGGASNLVAFDLSAAARDLEEIGKSGNLNEGEQCLEHLKQEFESLESYVKQWLEKGSTGITIDLEGSREEPLSRIEEF